MPSEWRAAVRGDVRDGLVQVVHHLQAQHQRHPLGVEIVRAGGLRRRRWRPPAQRGQRARLGAEGDAVARQVGHHARQALVRATAWWTSSVSSALHTDGRCTLALRMTGSAASRSALLSTYRWQTPMPPVMTGMVPLRAAERWRAVAAARDDQVHVVVQRAAARVT